MKHHDQRGAAHLLLILIFVIGLIGVLGFLGYSAWQRQSANAGGAKTEGTTDTVKVMTANIAGSHRVAELTDRIKTMKPQFVVLSEAQNAREFLSGIEHYQLVQAGTGNSKRGDAAILVQDTVTVLSKDYIDMNTTWTGPHGEAQPARTFPFIRAKTAHATWNLIGIHFPWKAAGSTSGQNSDAWNESWNKVTGYFDRQNNVTLATGDWNEFDTWVRPKAAQAKLDFVAGTKVDHAVTKKRPSVPLNESPRQRVCTAGSSTHLRLKQIKKNQQEKTRPFG